MENSTKNQSLGGGIITISILYIVFSGIGLIGGLVSIFALSALGAVDEFNGLIAGGTALLVVSSIIAVVNIINASLILAKKKIGVILFYSLVALSFIISIVSGEFGEAIIGLILPGLLAYFIYNKKDLYGFGVIESSDNTDYTSY